MSERTSVFIQVRDELLALRDNKGLINVRRTVQWARKHKSSALHAQLNWDDESAGEDWRCHQVRQLIALHITRVAGERQFISLSIDRNSGRGNGHVGGYRALVDVMKKPDLRAIMLQDALTELERVRTKYDGIAELNKVWEEAAKVRERSAAKAKVAA